MLFQSILKIYFAFLFASLIFVSTGFSQSTSYLDSLDGKFALQFQINENFSLSNFQGTTLSGKYHFSARDAVRLGLSLSFSDSDGEVSSNALDTINVITNTIDNSSYGITVNTQYIRYIKGTDDISFFAGGGPFIDYSTSTSNGEIREKQPVEKYKSTRDSYSLGMNLLLGVEWWFHKYMSLSAEYGMKFMYRYRKTINELGVVRRELSEKNFRISANIINFGITVYF
ncbi:MAG: hypothetical protein BMS9Abin39_0768 [Ignavibacteria bacterium]|nr:MAG: hypothetical protein BMS9Abin39_0768 [Ignavibacteria bacterium]